MPKVGEATTVTIAQGMLKRNTPIQDYSVKYGLFVKREDLSCPAPGPPFSKARGVYAHLLNIEEEVIGVLDTAHSQAGWAVARACKLLGKQCVNYYPRFVKKEGPHVAQIQAESLGAELVPIQAGMSAVLFHIAKRDCTERGGYMMPNALKLVESVTETAKEVPNRQFDQVVIAASSGTLAAGVIRGFSDYGLTPHYLIHLGYSRSHDEVLKYLNEKSGDAAATITLIDERYAYKDQAKPGETPPWPCNAYYDLKAFRWWMANGSAMFKGSTLFWNIG